MGYVIIKDLNGSKNYALNRLIQNLIPKDSAKREYIDVSTISFSYGESSNGIYKLASVNLGNATLPYVYQLGDTYTGISIDDISGTITVEPEALERTISVKLLPLFDGTYYKSAGHSTSPKVISVTVAPPELDSSEVHTDTYDISISSFTYREAPATGGSSTPTVNYVIYKNGDPLTNVAAQLRYTTTSESTGPVTASTDTNFATNGIINFGNNSSDSKQYFTHILVTATYLDVSDTAEANAQQSAATTPSEDVYSELDWDKGFVLPTFIRMNGYTGDITLPENLRQTLNGDPVDTTNAVYEYKIGTGNYLALDTTARTIYVGTNETNAPQDVSITVRVSLNNKERTATTTITNYPQEYVNGVRNSYLDGYTVLTIEKTGDYQGSISQGETPTLSGNGYHTKAFEGAAGILKVIAYHTLSFSTHVGLLSTTLRAGIVETISSTSTNYTALKKEGTNSRTGQIIDFGTVNASTNYSIGVRDEAGAFNVYYKIEQQLNN